MEREYFNKYFHYERSHWYFKARNKIILNHIKSLKTNNNGKLKILNIGVGTGYTSELLEELGQVKSIEYDKESCDLVKQKTKLDITHGSITNLPYEEGSFDIVCAFDVIEHVQNDCLAFKEMRRVCKKSGYIVITVPAFMSLWSSHDVINHHFRRYLKRDIEKLIDRNNLDSHYTSYFNFLLFIPIFVYRKIKNFRKLFITNNYSEKNYSDFEVMNNGIFSFLHKLFFSIFYSENLVIKYGKFCFPFGVSIISSSRK